MIHPFVRKDREGHQPDSHNISASALTRWIAAGTFALSSLLGASLASADDTAQPDNVSIPGDLQEAIGCPGNWAPECAETQLTRGEDGIWRGAFMVPAGEWQYKVAINNGWGENYGQRAERDGADIDLSLAEETEVRFYYSHASHWVADSDNHLIASAVGDFQTYLGCEDNWSPDCLRGWMQDINNGGIYQFTTTDIPVGDYNAKVAFDEAWGGDIGDGEGNNVEFSVEEAGEEITFSFNSANNAFTVGELLSSGDLTQSSAYWLDETTIAWGVPTDADVKLHFDSDAQLSSSPDGVAGGESISLTYSDAGMPAELQERFPHLAQLPVFTVSAADLDQVPAILKQQIAVSASNSDGGLIDATGVQIPGVLDDLFTYEGQLGPIYDGDVPALKLWAPTAQAVSVLLYADAHPDTQATEMPMDYDHNTGVWSIQGSADWDRQYYRFQVDVYVPFTQNIERNLVTDPYTVGASMDGVRSQLVNLRDDDLKPEGWDELNKPAFTGAQDMVIYEVHMRDFSVHDPEVPEEYQGKFKAFTVSDSLGMQHLRGMQEVGVSHLHLLPVNDCATIPENPADQQTLDEDLSVYAPDSTEQQAAIEAIRGSDAFNWCYDPHHFNVPEGSYATDPDGTARILEFREMVQALNEAGLRVVVDVVYNHTSQSRLGDKSVLDKVVPGYYHRLNATGGIERSTCCENTATEHNMMEKFMVDSMMVWAELYKVDSFRFDLMGHHSKANMLKVREQLATLTEAEHGVDGESIYLYGEGWNFGEVANDARFEQATQGNMAGTGIGTFNDRFRDAVRGGSPFDSGLGHVTSQSFINGLYYDPNAENSGSTGELEQLMRSTDRIRIGLIGSLRDYEFTDWQGNAATGDYGAAVGYTMSPQESINYIEKHDNETLFDINQYKIPLDRTPEDRVRVHNMGGSLVFLAQGVPFMQAGQELLRSKSMDRDSYDSGDWFNLLDYSYQDNGWGRGLPPAHSNEASWDVMQPRLADETLAVDETHILQALAHTKEMLSIRQSSKLFRMDTAEQVMTQISFHNTGADQLPALVAMQLRDEHDLDPEREAIMVIFNAHVDEQQLSHADWEGLEFALHPVQQNSADARVQEASFDDSTGTFSVPARTTAVFQISQVVEDDNGEENGNGNGVDDGAGTPPADGRRRSSGSVSTMLLALMGLLGLGLVGRRRMAV